MIQEKKHLLIVDDTKIDRMVLKGILGDEFEVLEANSGNMAFEYLTMRRDQLDAVLLDLSMPHIDGFDVLKFMKDKGLDDIPVFVITADPTRDNVEKALQYHIDDFIGKPLDKEEVLWRLRSRLGIIPEFNLGKEEITETMKYISDLETFYKTYLTNFGKDDKHYKAMADLMRILLTSYSKTSGGIKLPPEGIEIVSKAAYFCDIGKIVVPDNNLQIMLGHLETQGIKQAHTMYGFNLIRLNRSKSCKYFVEVCSSMCLHHHERFDGKGYPHGITGKNNSIFNQMCKLVDEFVKKRGMFYGSDVKPIKYIMRRLINDDAGMVSKEVYSVFDDCEPMVVSYFLKKDIG